ncbi:hypothetical protein QF031_002074 [Pseudarthrobacter defluvii]|uniref:hypothetical protein n=1 Tax=Pseudarthrobacter defluvii TaxID=410837 RepID=UPI002788E25C|nr:hypothetical protein [Pseudarthrobacter defluvii]MDQ0769325.1 hypothetical protein [Pseudarthrobacter defluvii]
MASTDSLQEACSLLEAGDVSLLHLWLLYWGQGGNADLTELDAFIHGVPLLDDMDAAILGWALEALSAP